MAGVDGRESATPATTPIVGSAVPTRGELQARWTCHCELLGLVRPRVAGSHTADAVLCPQRVKAGEGAGWRVGDVVEVLVPAMPAAPSDFPKAVHSLWKLIAQSEHPVVTWALCLKMRSRPNPLWGVLDEDQMRDKGTPAKTVLVPGGWESWAIRSDVVRGVWAGWSGEPAKPDVFKVRGVRGLLNHTEAMKIIKSM